MDVSRVGQRPDALLQESASPRRETRTERPEPQARVEPAQPPRETKKVASPEPEPAKPVVNTQGQVTGTRINTSA